MKILHINYDDGLGGASRATLRLHQALLKKKIKSNLLLFKQKNKIKNKSIIVLKKNNFLNLFTRSLSYVVNRIHNLNKINFYRSYNFFNNSKLVNYINKSNYDLVHLHWVNSEMISIDDLSKINKKIVWTLHDLWPVLPTRHISLKTKLDFKKISKFDNYFYSKKKNFFKKDLSLICPSKFISKKIASSEISKRKFFKIIPNTIDINFWKRLNKINCKKKFNFSKKKKIILYNMPSKNDDFVKGLDIFLQIIKKLKLKDIKIVFFGSNRKNVLNKLNCDYKNIGFVRDDLKLRTLYNSADIVVSTSRFESFGQIILEAQCCGVPTVAFKHTGMDDIIMNNKTGYLVPNNNHEFVANKILSILYKKKINITKKEIKKLKSKFSNENISKMHINFYKKILNEK